LTSLAGTLALARTAAADQPVAGSSADVLAPRNPPDFTVLDLDIEGDKKLATRFTLFVPNHLAKDERVPLLVLFHGLGETWDTGIGVYAWVERYGLGTAYARLRRPPVTRTWQRGNLLPDARLGELNAALAAQPFRGMAIACPYTPNVQKLPNPSGALDAYADWIIDALIPRARKEAPVFPDVAHTALDGVSLGGLISFEVFVRRPDAFTAVGGVQSAINAVRLPHYTDKLAAAFAKAAKTSVHIETSEQDPFRESNVGLAKMLEKKGVGCDLAILPGLHDQVFLREAGSMEMLLWHDRRMR
jgi:pimeloyl-ACP methyl ester carboxylesterase